MPPRALLLLLVLMAPAADSQDGPALGLDALDGLVERAVAHDLLSEAGADQIRGCAADDLPVTRGALLDAVAQHVCAREGVPCGPFEFAARGLVIEDPPADAPRPVPPSWPDTLAAAGLLTEAERERFAPLADELIRIADSTYVPPGMAALMLPKIARSVLAQEPFHPALLADDVERWAAAGLLTDEAGDRMLADAAAGTLPLQSPLAPYADGVVRLAPGDEGSEADVLREAVALANRRLEAPLVLGAARVETEERTYRGIGDVRRAYTVSTLVADLDGWSVRRFLPWSSPGNAAVFLVNQALRDRGEAVGVGVVTVVESVKVAEPWRALLVVDRPRLDALAAGIEVGFDDGPPALDTARGRLAARIRAFAGPGPREDCGRLLFTSAVPLLRAHPLEGGSLPVLDPDDVRRRDRIQPLFAALVTAGVLPDADPDVLTEAYFESLASSSDGEDLLDVLPESDVYPFDWEATTVPPDYVGEIGRLAALTRGAWRPENVVAEPVAGDALALAFEVDGRPYRTLVDVDGDWFQRPFLDLVLRSVAETVPDGRFYWVDGSRERMVFLTRAQAAALGGVPVFAELAPVGAGR